MAIGAIAREAGLDVVWLPGGPKLGRVTTEAVCGRALKLASHVAGFAGLPRMGAVQGKLREASMVKPGSLPQVYAMALFTREWKSGSGMIRRRGRPVLSQVTARALGAETDEDTGRRAGMAAFALNGGMCSQQRKAVAMILNGLHGLEPALNGVTILAAGAELPAVKIGVAVGTLRTDIAEVQVPMALGAGYGCVHAPQRVGCLGVVIELRDRSDGLPSSGCVATLAR